MQNTASVLLVVRGSCLFSDSPLLWGNIVIKHSLLCVPSSPPGSVFMATEEMEKELRLLLTENWSDPRWPHSDFVAPLSLHECMCRYCDSRHLRGTEPPTLLILRVIHGKSVGGRGLWPCNEGNQILGLFGDQTLWPWYYFRNTLD